MSYTKGVWYYTNYNTDRKEYQIRSKDGGLDCHIANVGSLTALPDSLYNARLMAASPELYEALKGMLWEGESTSNREAAKEALAKAEEGI